MAGNLITYVSDNKLGRSLRAVTSFLARSNKLIFDIHNVTGVIDGRSFIFKNDTEVFASLDETDEGILDLSERHARRGRECQ